MNDEDSTDIYEEHPMSDNHDTARELGKLSAEVALMIRQNKDITRRLNTVSNGLNDLKTSVQLLRKTCGDGTSALYRKETVGEFFGRLAKKALEIVIVSAIVAGIVAALGSAYFKSQITEAITSSHNQGG